MTHSKHMLAALLGLTLALTACSSEQGGQIQELPRPDFIEAGQNFTGAPHFKYTLGPGEDADCEGVCESVVDSCSMAFNAHTVAIIRPGVSEFISYERGCTQGGAFNDTYVFEGEVMAVAGGQKLPKTARFVMPASSSIKSHCIYNSESFLTPVRIVNGQYWLAGCLPIETGSFEAVAVSEDLIIQLPSSFEEFSLETQRALSDYLEVCQKEPAGEFYDMLDREFARHEECPLYQPLPNSEPEDDEPGGDEFEN